MKGHIKIFVKSTKDKDYILKSLKKGGFFGELSFLFNTPRIASAIAEG